MTSVALIVPGHSITETSQFQPISPTQAISPVLNVAGTQIALSLTNPLPSDAAACVFWVDEGHTFLGFLGNATPSLIVAVPRSSGSKAGGETVVGQVGISMETLQTAQTMTAVSTDINTLVALHVARKILNSFFEYASGFVATVMGREVVPMKELVSWQEKTQSRLKTDPAWLLRGFST